MSSTRVYNLPRARLLSPARVRELSRLEPARVVRDTARLWIEILAAFALVAWHPAWWTVLVAFPIVGTRYYALFVIAHDGLHRRLFERARTNDLFCDLFLLGPIGAVTRVHNRNHRLHHKHLATASDPDRHRHACFNKTTQLETLAFLTGATALATSFRNVFLRRRKPRSEAPGSRLRPRELAVIGVWQVLLVGGLTTAIGWWAWPVLWLAPCYVHFYLGDLIRSFLEHSQPEADSRADSHRLISYEATPLERILLAPNHMNHHAAHHLWPSIPYYNLGRAEREMRELPGSDAIEWRHSYLGYLLRYWRALPLPECRGGA
ncbi:hypothetical protein MYXO_00893 [Myxococcaceae bacterium]|nr:hypothetical protein MYXO_00893 [Myxococcaceae bacterium]